MKHVVLEGSTMEKNIEQDLEDKDLDRHEKHEK